jgi:hypothetical protein
MPGASVRITTLVAVLTALLSVLSAQVEPRDVMVATVTPQAATLVAGEPLQVELALRNTGSAEVAIDLGADRKEAVTVQVWFPDGSEKIGRITPHGSLMRIGKIRLGPGEVYSQFLILNEWVELPGTGICRITIHLNNKATAANGDTLDIGSATLTVTVAARNEIALAQFCSEVVNRMLTANNYSRALSAAEALSYIHDPVAVPYLKKAFQNRYRLDALFVQTLEKMGTEDAISALVEVAESHQSTDPALVMSALGRLSKKTSDPNLQARIRDVLRTGEP